MKIDGESVSIQPYTRFFVWMLCASTASLTARAQVAQDGGHSSEGGQAGKVTDVRPHVRPSFPVAGDAAKLVATAKVVKNGWYAGQALTDDGNWYKELEQESILQWNAAWPTPNLKWYTIQPYVNWTQDGTAYTWVSSRSADEILYYIQGADATTPQGWGGTMNFSYGTMRYFVQEDAPGDNGHHGIKPFTSGWKTTTDENQAHGVPAQLQSLVTPLATGPHVVRVSTRALSYNGVAITDPIAQWAFAWVGVPFLFPRGDAKHTGGPNKDTILQFIGTDCSGLLWGAQKMARRDSPHCPKVKPLADEIATNDDWTYAVTRNLDPAAPTTQQGDLLLFDYENGTDPTLAEGGPDGHYDHSMICIGGSLAIWSGVGYPWVNYQRCVIVSDWTVWKAYVENTTDVYGRRHKVNMIVRRWRE